MPSWHPELEAVVAFTGHAYVLLGKERPAGALGSLALDGLGRAHDPRVISRLAGLRGWIDTLDLVMVRSVGPPTALPLVERPDLASHPRARFAACLRRDLRVLGLEDGSRSALVTIGAGLGGLPEIGFEVEEERRGQREGALLIARALAALRPTEVVVACVAPGNAASLRLLWSVGFVPIASVQFFGRERPGGICSAEPVALTEES